MKLKDFMEKTENMMFKALAIPQHIVQGIKIPDNTYYNAEHKEFYHLAKASPAIYINPYSEYYGAIASNGFCNRWIKHAELFPQSKEELILKKFGVPKDVYYSFHDDEFYRVNYEGDMPAGKKLDAGWSAVWRRHRDEFPTSLAEVMKQQKPAAEVKTNAANTKEVEVSIPGSIYFHKKLNKFYEVLLDMGVPLLGNRSNVLFARILKRFSRCLDQVFR